MQFQSIPFKDTGYFSKIIVDYLAQSERIQPFYKDYPTIESFKEFIESKKQQTIDRELLVNELKEQYKNSGIKKADATFANIELLKDAKTFTITTGHQLNLFSGPLYFIYKIVSVINLCQQLKKAYPEYNFVPMYWMATEDHDFAEINHFNFKEHQIKWDSKQKGAVGRFNLQGLDKVYQEFEALLIDYNENSTFLKELFQKAYLKQDNLANATRVLVHELFYDKGLVIIDGDSDGLKAEMVAIFKEELSTEISSHLIEKTNQKLEDHYKIQVNPREINLFYLADGLRERILKKDGNYFVNNTELEFSGKEFFELLQNQPSAFSPNVVLRPLYQEKILPNLAYIGGGGELAYWFQLKSVFEHFKVPFPALILRNSAAFLDNKETKIFEGLQISLQELFKPTVDLIKHIISRDSEVDLSLEQEKIKLESAYKDIIDKAKKLDVTLVPHFEASLKKHLKQLEHGTKKLIRAEKRNKKELIQKIEKLKGSLFPNGGLQERNQNFSAIYYHYGAEFIEELYQHFNLPSEDFSLFLDQ